MPLWRLSMKTGGTLRGRDREIYEQWHEENDRDHWRKYHARPEELRAAHLKRVQREIGIWESDADLRELAKQRADFMLDWVIEQPGFITLEAINDKLESLEARPLEWAGNPTPEEKEKKIQGFVKRLGCEFFWRRNVRRAQVQKREAQEQAAGHICARAMPYVHNVTVTRHKDRQEANRAMLEATEIEDASGEVITLWAAAQAGTANKSIRRGELMTRIRGCEEWATARGMVGIFTTNTLPSRFHASLFGGGKNPNFDGSTPRDGQSWLSKTWARARAKIQRQRVGVFGFRVAEPHHDGCPHWHMLLWAKPEQVEALQAILRAAWLQEAGDEYGAQEYRFKAERIDPARGGAIAYVAKYIAKNIDDAGGVGEEGHLDHQGQQKQLIDGAKAQRVTAWASAWGIRQFQPIGQPPVTVWRELRRVNPGDVAAASKRMQRAYEAVHKHDTARADWAKYMTEQGGAMVGRGYQLRLDFKEETKQGRYGETEVKTAQAVYDIARPGEFCNSQRKQWKPKGTWTPAERRTATVGTWGDLAVLAVLDPTWTRFNNCTQANQKPKVKRANSWQILAGDWPKPEPLRDQRRTT